MEETRSITVVHLYPDIMNIYGDRGNIIALKHRAAMRGIAVDVVDVTIGDKWDPADADLIVIGGGQDREQRRIAGDLVMRGPAIRREVELGLPVLAVCGGFQLFGHRYVDHEGGIIPGIGVFDLETRHPGPRADRCIGDVVIRTEHGEIVGFENHGGRTYLAPGQAPLGTVHRGFGNNAEDGTEGARTKNAIGTYLHGSLLPKNFGLCDELLTLAIRRRYGETEYLPAIDDRTERRAHASATAVAERRARKPASSANGIR